LAWIAALAMAALLVAARTARADTSFDGTWSESPMSESFTVREWVPSACGPAPVSGTAEGGGTVTVHAEGDELVFVGAGRAFRTNQCWDQMSTLVRVAHSRSPSGRAWSTRCATPPNDPRRANITTSIVASTDTRIDIIETGRYEITHSEGSCVADVKRTRSLNLVARAGSAPSASASSAPPPASTVAAPPPSPPPPPPNVDCSAPGEPARLEVRPSRKLLRSGETFTFRATVRDAKGCPTATPTSWVLDTSCGASCPVVDRDGKVTIPSDLTEGSFDISVTASGKSTKVTVEVTSAARYDELLAESGLNAEGEKADPSVAVLTTGSLGGRDARSDAEPRMAHRVLFLGVAASALAVLGIVVVVGRRRARKAEAVEREAAERHATRLREFEDRKRAREAEHSKQMQAHLESVKRAQEQMAAMTTPYGGEMVCPSCKKEFPAGKTFCPDDANRLIPLAGHEDVLTGPSGGICPTCHKGYNPGVKVCPDDQDELVPYSVYARREDGARAPSRGKICPTCGDRFEGTASFCGKDGTALVLVN
jgi:siroheme synthase (precorrin-2 oxidase/ferrochelatase)